MHSEEQRLIDSLFQRLQQAENGSAPRDAAAEQRIQQQLKQQPNAPYYMAQAILIQEAALKKLNDRVSELEQRLAHPPQQSSGGFLAGLFGGGAQQTAAPQQTAQPPQYGTPPPQYAAQPAARGGSFLGGALQTAVGVAGGVVMADMLTSLFHHTQPQEIVNIINDDPLPEVTNNLDTFNQGDHGQFLNQDAGLPQDYTNDLGDLGNDDVDNNADDDGFV